MRTKTKISDNAFYEVVGTLSGGAELRRYTFYDGTGHSAIVDDCTKLYAPLEHEDDFVAWWETEIEALRWRLKK